MSVLITGMNMPKNCKNCPFSEATARLYCNNYVLSMEDRPEWCPLADMENTIRSKLFDSYEHLRSAFRYAVKSEDKSEVAWIAALLCGIVEVMNIINELEVNNG